MTFPFNANLSMSCCEEIIIARAVEHGDGRCRFHDGSHQLRSFLMIPDQRDLLEVRHPEEDRVPTPSHAGHLPAHYIQPSRRKSNSNFKLLRAGS